jgi:hypothetical protein
MYAVETVSLITTTNYSVTFCHLTWRCRVFAALDRQTTRAAFAFRDSTYDVIHASCLFLQSLIGRLTRSRMGPPPVAVVCVIYANPLRQTRQIILVIVTYRFVFYDGFS